MLWNKYKKLSRMREFFICKIKPPDSLGVHFRFTDEQISPFVLKFVCSLTKLKTQKEKKCLNK